MVGKIVMVAAAIAVAALLLVDIAGWANTNKLEAQGPRIDPLKLMLDAKDLPIEECALREGGSGSSPFVVCNSNR
jgi:hypothetical protein